MTTTSSSGLRHLDAEPAGDLVAHGREAVFDVVAAGRARLPQLVQLARQPARGADQRRLRAARALHRADDLRVGRQRHWSGRSRPSAAFSQSALAVFAVASRRPATSSRRAVLPSASSPALASATSGSARCLPASKGLHVQPDDLDAVRLEQRPGAGGEILQPGADRQHDVGLLGQQVGGRRAGDADRSPC